MVQALLLIPAGLSGQTRVSHHASNSPLAEQRAAAALEKARGNPLDLHAFLAAMPKGADLHNHLSGAIYAESFIRAGVEDGLCVELATHSFARQEGTGAATAGQPACGNGMVPASNAYADQHLYDALIDAFSMRGFVPTPGRTGHDQFFDTFDRFGGVAPRHFGEWLDEVATRAAAQNEQYLELMDTPDFRHAIMLARQIGWKDDLTQLRGDLLAQGLKEDIALARAHLDSGIELRNQREHCGQAGASPACKVEIRFIYQILRALPKEVVFAQTLLGFETASADSREVGINFVQPEDARVPMADYALHMRMVEFLHGLYPQVHITLHAGELAPGMVPPDGLCCHIRLAVEQAHAERIGHGVDVMQEDRPYQLLKEMAAKHVMVEINLTSNDVILGVSGEEHPLPVYRRFGVPVSLSTDDEGVSRIDMTHEYVRAVETYDLRYADLKKMVRTGIEHTFLPGASLWTAPDAFGHVVAACSRDVPGAGNPSAACGALLQSSQKARQQWELEGRFREFEASFGK